MRTGTGGNTTARVGKDAGCAGGTIAVSAREPFAKDSATRRYAQRRRAPLADRFAAKVDRNGPVHPALGTRCWLWTGSVSGTGYGNISAGDGKVVYAHRVAFALAHDLTPTAIPSDLYVCHRCDTPLCMNPAHLFLGTCADNLRDMREKGRHPHASRTHCKRGHEFTPENTYRPPGKTSRHCIACRDARQSTSRTERVA